ncbi:MAG: radical SAM protein [Candidatus Delongbacteria bacterium]|nr:radical SAM protein [Candidatus Delongbacteria bacterium]
MNIQILHIRSERVLSPTGIEIADYTVNPYRGCSFGCRYCYVRLNQFARRHPLPYGSYVEIKDNLLELLSHQLNHQPVKKILIGSVTDPYQPVEKEYRMTRRILALLAEREIACTILTKSDLILRDIDWLKQLPKVTICFTLNDPEIISRLEHQTPRLETRMDAIAELNHQGIYTYAHIGPYFPFITHYETFLHRLGSSCRRINFESPNFKMIENPSSLIQQIGMINPDLPAVYHRLMTDQAFYDHYWQTLEEEIRTAAGDNHYTITCLFRPFDRYYKNDPVI